MHGSSLQIGRLVHISGNCSPRQHTSATASHAAASSAAPVPTPRSRTAGCLQLLFLVRAEVTTGAIDAVFAASTFLGVLAELSAVVRVAGGAYAPAQRWRHCCFREGLWHHLRAHALGVAVVLRDSPHARRQLRGHGLEQRRQKWNDDVSSRRRRWRGRHPAILLLTPTSREGRHRRPRLDHREPARLRRWRPGGPGPLLLPVFRHYGRATSTSPPARCRKLVRLRLLHVVLHLVRLRAATGQVHSISCRRRVGRAPTAAECWNAALRVAEDETGLRHCL